MGKKKGSFKMSNIVPESEIKMKQKHRQTERISCHEKLSFSKGNTSQEITGWVGTAGERLRAKISSAIQAQCVSNRANFLRLFGRAKTVLIKYGQDAFTLLLPFLFSSPLFLPLSHSTSGPSFICLLLSNFLSLLPSCLAISSHPVSSLYLTFSSFLFLSLLM